MEKEFLIPNNIKQAVTMKNADFVFLAGGTEINRLGSSVKDKSVISLKNLNLNQITRDNDYIYIGSTCTFQEVYENKYTPDYLKQACLFMASRTRRNMATVGGNIALLRTDSYLIPTLVAAKAKLILQNNAIKSYTVQISDYIRNNKKYAGSLILSVVLSRSIVSVKSKRCSNTALSHSFITVSVSRNEKDFNLFAGIKNAGFSDFSKIRDAMNTKRKVSCDEIIQLVRGSSELELFDDIYGSVEYKQYLLGETIFEVYSDLLKGGAK